MHGGGERVQGGGGEGEECVRERRGESESAWRGRECMEGGRGKSV